MPLRQKVGVEASQLLGTKCTCPPAAFLSNKRYSRCSISTKAWAAGWLGARLAGWLAGWLVGWLGHQNASKTCTLSQKVCRKRVPLSRKSTSRPFIIWDTNMRQKRVPLGRKSTSRPFIIWDTKMRQKRVPLGKKCVKNVYP